MAGFERTLQELYTQAAPRTVLDVGCGEGVLSAQWAQRPETERVVGIDLADPKLEAEWATRTHPKLEFRALAAERTDYADASFELVAATEVLEHVSDPEVVLAEMARVASRHLLVSVPHEPLWRGLNMARGAYLKDLGNTPGHLNHWTRRGFVAVCNRHGTVIEVRSPFPWTMLLVKVG